MPDSYPKFETEGTKQLFVFRFPKFNNKVVYDPTVYPGNADAVSGATPIYSAFSLLLTIILAGFLTV